MEICPLLQEPEEYLPDTIDLRNNPKERDYWLPCLERMVRKFVDKASILNPHKPQAKEEAEHCFRIFQEMIKRLNNNPEIMNPLSIRTLLEFNEKTLRSNNFTDAWLVQKQKETKTAFREFSSRLKYIDNIDTFGVRWLELVKGLLAGNMFDWGAKAVTDLLETTGSFGLGDAMNTIQKRPWFIDDLDEWIETLQKKSYKKVVIFVDNAGVDFVLGVIPLAREFIKRDTDVILSANTFPALNDITIKELNCCLQEASLHCPVIKNAVDSKKLQGIENGQGGPCLDLSKLNSGLCDKMKNVDLVMLEGMGRAVHTNLKAKFNIDSVKLAVLKNEWLAQSLGAQQFSIIFEFKPAPTF
ncbi:4'-phosphopantetheine phosphatase [Onthophagus taurus]|uniref:4'-phosphopantetheine phosphatase n=1 Tax=Onthophagus taurus TaxID=166361 RepID=UPI000C2053C3|nr:pantothenate kinase 4 [Onthophagus taurus]